MPSHDARPGAAVGRRRVLLPVLALTACSSGGPAVPPGTLHPTVPDLAGVHGEVRVEGLDDRRFGPAELWDAVEPIVADHPLFRVEALGRSAEDRPIRMISFGEGPVTVLLWSQMHGDESTATMALADVYAFMRARPAHPVAEAIRRGATVHTIPMLNPDGAARFQRRNAQGVDVNRDARALSTPEGLILDRARERTRPAFGFNLHDQNVRTRVGTSDRRVAIALLSPPFDESREIDEVRRAAMEVAGVIVEAIEPMVGGHVARYDDTFNPRAFGDLMTRAGVRTVLVESGGWEDDPQKQYLRRVNFVALLAALEAIATGRHANAGIATYQELPENGRSVSDLLVVGGTLAVPGLPPLRADLLVNYDEPLLERGGRIVDIGDLGGYEARDTLRADGLYLVPSDAALSRERGVHIETGAAAEFVASRTPDGSDPVWSFQGRPPPRR